jgi:glycosyltransferase involved in cell wall biosynthesis
MTRPIKIAPPGTPIPVLHLIVELSIGGAQSALLRLLAHHDRQRFKVQVACLYNGEGVIAQQIRAIGVPVIELGMTGKFRLDAVWRFYRLLHSQQPEILHTWMFHANIIGRLIGRMAGVPIIITSERTMGQEGIFRRWLNRYTAGMSDRIICVSNSVASFAKGTIKLPASKLVVIPNGVQLERFENLPAKSEARAKYKLEGSVPIIGAIGRPRPVKGYPVLIDAFSQLTWKHPSALLLFVGNGPESLKLIEQVNRLGISHRVIFFDDQPDITGLLPALDIVAIPSLHEGMPNVAIEAMAARLPIVATSVGGTPEVVINRETGFLVRPHDPEALANALSSLLEQPELRQRMGRAGRERAFQLFNIQNTIQLTQALYERLYNHD